MTSYHSAQVIVGAYIDRQIFDRILNANLKHILLHSTTHATVRKLNVPFGLQAEAKGYQLRREVRMPTSLHNGYACMRKNGLRLSWTYIVVMVCVDYCWSKIPNDFQCHFVVLHNGIGKVHLDALESNRSTSCCSIQ